MSALASRQHNQLHSAAGGLPQPVKAIQKRRRSDDSDDDMDQTGSRSPSPEKQQQQRAMAPVRSAKRLLANKKARADTSTDKQSEGGNANGEDGSDLADARVLLGKL